MSDRIKSYYFSSLRRGIGAKAAEGANDGGKRPVFEVLLNPGYMDKGGSDKGKTTETLRLEVSVYGPGDVLAFDPDKIVSRIHPTSNDFNFTSSNVPFIEFTEPDFVWRYSGSTSGNHWIPWLSLIVLKVKDGEEDGEFTDLGIVDHGLPPRIELSSPDVLPDLNYAWRWTHVQVNAPANADQNIEYLTALIRQNPSPAVCRMLCPRRLEASTKYTAFVVPTYKLGWETAMGIADSPTAKDRLSWDISDEQQMKDILQKGLPYYYSWEFRTSHRGDFEQLARMISVKEWEPADGEKINVHNPGYGLGASKNDPLRVVDMQGALQADTAASENEGGTHEIQPDDLESDLKKLLESAVEANRELKVVPPIYGRWINHSQWEEATVNTGEGKDWLSEINLDLRYRIAAGLGVQYVKENQEALMAEAWKQLQKTQEINQQLNVKRLGIELSRRRIRRFERTRPEKFLEFSKPLHKKLEISLKPKQAYEEGSTGTTLKKSIVAHLKEARFSGISLEQKAQQFLGKKYNKKAPATDGPSLVTMVPVSSETTSLYLTAVRDKSLDELQPEKTMQSRLSDRLKKIRQWENKTREGQGLEPVDHSSNGADENDLDNLQPVMAYPEFHAPMYHYLLSLSEDYFIPGIEHIPQNTIVPLTTNPKFIEAFMLGLNHEFASELRWREYPTDMRGSYFRKFWDTTIYSVDEEEMNTFWDSAIADALKNRLGLSEKEIKECYDKQEPDKAHIALALEEAIEQWLLTLPQEKDMLPLHQWTADSLLGSHRYLSDNTDDEGQFVMLIRAELLRQFPNMFIYLFPTKGEEDKTPVYPSFEANLPPDITCLGFPVSKSAASKYLLVLEERLSEHRYGLDATKTTKASPTKVENLSWEHFDEDEHNSFEGYLDGTPPKGNDAKDHWNNPAYIAKAFTQKPVRVVMPLEGYFPEPNF